MIETFISTKCVPTYCRRLRQAGATIESVTIADIVGYRVIRWTV